MSTAGVKFSSFLLGINGQNSGFSSCHLTEDNTKHHHRTNMCNITKHIEIVKTYLSVEFLHSMSLLISTRVCAVYLISWDISSHGPVWKVQKTLTVIRHKLFFTNVVKTVHWISLHTGLQQTLSNHQVVHSKHSSQSARK